VRGGAKEEEDKPKLLKRIFFKVFESEDIQDANGGGLFVPSTVVVKGERRVDEGQQGLEQQVVEGLGVRVPCHHRTLQIQILENEIPSNLQASLRQGIGEMVLINREKMTHLLRMQRGVRGEESGIVPNSL
jgi:hypothetical protein